MAKERKASVIYEGNASQLVYAFPFDYLRKKFVKVEDIYTNITELTIGVDYTVEDKQVRLVKGIPLGHSVKIYRETTTAPLVEWQDASVLRSADLSLQEVQLLHLAEETAVAGLLFNVIADPLIGYYYKLWIIGKPAAELTLAWNIAATSINAVTSTIASVVIYMAVRPALRKAGFLDALSVEARA